MKVHPNVIEATADQKTYDERTTNRAIGTSQSSIISLIFPSIHLLYTATTILIQYVNFNPSSRGIQIQ